MNNYDKRMLSVYCKKNRYHEDNSSVNVKTKTKCSVIENV